MVRATDEAIENCDKEPIHIPGTCQAFGCLIAVHKSGEKVAAISTNCNEFFDIEARNAIGTDLVHLLGPDACHELINKLSYSTIRERREFAATISPKGRSVELFVHSSGDFDIIECVPASPSVKGVQDRIAALTMALQTASEFDHISQLAVNSVRAITNFDRVMFYRFLPDGAGEVVAEDRSGHMESFLGLRYPAWDIPKQARSLYTKTPIRVIGNVRGEDAPIEFEQGLSSVDLDLSRAVLRGTSPVHLEYLANMGVAATLTIPIVVDGQLWGLIACHHESTVQPNINALDAAEIIGHILSYGMAQFLQRSADKFRAPISQIKNEFVGLQTRVIKHEQFAQVLSDAAGCALEFDGVAVSTAGQWSVFGDAPAGNIELPLGDQYTSNSGVLEFSSDAAAGLDAAGVSGLAGFLTVPVSKEPPVAFHFFRKAGENEVRWGGAPDKHVEHVDGEKRLSPRKSFAAYVAQHKDKSEEWSSADIEFASALQRECIESLGAAGTIMKQKDSLRILADELNHRVKNILALVQSIAAQSRDHSQSAEDYSKSLEQRLFALAASHELLTQSNMRGVGLKDLVQAELEPFVSAKALETAYGGPDLMVLPEAVPMMSLLLHELTSNAAKHGALSDTKGTVKTRWKVDGEYLVIDWQETGGPAVKEPSRTGFGMSLLRQAIPYEFDGGADLTFGEKGFSASYRLPIVNVVHQTAAPEAVPASKTEVPAAKKSFQDARALVVEDSYLLAAEHSSILSDIGFLEVDCASSVRTANAALDKNSYDLVLLDVNLRGELSFEIADRLLGTNTQIYFVTGYDSAANMPERLGAITMLKKPLKPKALGNLIMAAMGAG
ncbi:MAG: HWE histidine kinase domain-containing protein [Marinomonas sp.]